MINHGHERMRALEANQATSVSASVSSSMTPLPAAGPRRRGVATQGQRKDETCVAPRRLCHFCPRSPGPHQASTLQRSNPHLPRDAGISGGSGCRRDSTQVACGVRVTATEGQTPELTAAAASRVARIRTRLSTGGGDGGRAGGRWAPSWSGSTMSVSSLGSQPHSRSPCAAPVVAPSPREKVGEGRLRFATVARRGGARRKRGGDRKDTREICRQARHVGSALQQSLELLEAGHRQRRDLGDHSARLLHRRINGAAANVPVGGQLARKRLPPSSKSGGCLRSASSREKSACFSAGPPPYT